MPEERAARARVGAAAMIGIACSRREERPDFSISVPFCTILVPFWGVGNRRGGVGGFGAGPAGGRAGFFDFCTILYHFVPFWGVGSRRGRVGGFGAGAAYGHDMSQASVAGLDWVRRYGKDLTCIYDMGNLWGWARGKCQWFGATGARFSPPLNLSLRKRERSGLVQTG